MYVNCKDNNNKTVVSIAEVVDSLNDDASPQPSKVVSYGNSDSDSIIVASSPSSTIDRKLKLCAT